MRTTMLLIVLALGGCGVDVYEAKINPPPTAMTSRPAATVEVFTSGQPARPHVDVAMLQAEPHVAYDVPSTQLVGKLREIAAAMGCDGLVITQLDVRLPPHGEKRSATGTCVMWQR